MRNAAATGSRASAARERAIATATPIALAPWCAAATTAPGALETETTAALNHLVLQPKGGYKGGHAYFHGITAEMLCQHCTRAVKTGGAENGVQRKS